MLNVVTVIRLSMYLTEVRRGRMRMRMIMMMMMSRNQAFGINVLFRLNE